MLIEVTSRRGFTFSVCPEGHRSVATIARESGEPIVLEGRTHQKIILDPVANHEAAIHDATILIDRLLRGWRKKTQT